MSVDTLRETFHINRVRPSQLDDFLSAQTYRDEITNAYKKIETFETGTLQSLCDEKIRQGPTPVYGSTGEPCFKSKHTNELIVSEVNGELVDPDFAEANKKHKIKTGNLVITRKGSGTIGRVSIYLGHKALNSDDSLFKVALTGADAAYVAAYLSSYWGERLLEKGVYGSTGQLSLSSGHIQKLPIIIFTGTTQKYIGDKVLQAERLRASAKCRYMNFRERLREELEAIAPKSFFELEKIDMGQVSVRVKEREISDRLDAWFYKPEFTKAARVLSEAGESGANIYNIKDIATVEYGFMPLEDYWDSSSGHPFLRVTNIKDQLVVNDDDIRYVNPVESKAEKYRLRGDDIVIVQLGNSTGRVAFVSEKYNEWAYPSFSLRVRVNDPRFDPAFLAVFLSEKLGQNQISRTISITSVRPNTTKPAIESIAIPELDMCIQSSIGGLLRKATSSLENSKSLVRSAKLLVESLIEGKITEEELICAQKALESDDNSLDRDILSRFTTKGLDGEGDPLFTDLDQLYDLLAQSQQIDQ